MRRFCFCIASLLTVVQPAFSQTANQFNHDDGYVLGFVYGEQLRALVGGGIESSDVLAGLNDSLAGQTGRFAADQIEAKKTSLFAVLKQREALARTALIKGNGDRWTQEEKLVEADPSYKKIADGVYYCEVSAGSGAKPTLLSPVHVRMAECSAGAEKDLNNEKADKHLVVATQVPGLQDVLTSMAVGGSCKAYVAPEQGFGDVGSGQSVEPGAGLYVEIDLLAIE